MLKIENLQVSLHRKTILQNITCQAAPGAVTVIVGPNGSGKSTLLRAVSGELASRGRMSLNDCDIQTAKPWELAEHRAVLPQTTPMSFPFQVQEVVALGLRDRVTRNRAGFHVMQALARVGLAGYENRLYQQLSGGEQQRTQLARVLCQIDAPVCHGTARWLFLDEPVSSLDIAHQLQVMQIARDFADQGGGVLLVIHDLNLAAMFADHVWVMDQGCLAAQGAVAEALNERLLSDVYNCPVRIGELPADTSWFFLPQAVGRGQATAQSAAAIR